MSFKIDSIGIALAAYNPDAQYFLEQLYSIQNQTYPNWVCVISFDSDPELFLSKPDFVNIWKDGRFKIIKNPSRLGAKRNFENAIREVVKQGVDAFACADQDDIWFPNKLQISRDELIKRGAGSLVHSDMTIMYEKNGKWRDRKSTAWQVERRGIKNSRPQDFLIRNTVAGAALLADIEIAKKFPDIPEAFPFHDHWYALVASTLGGVYPILLPLYRYRQHGHNVLGIHEHKGLISLRDKPWQIQTLIKKLSSKYEWSLNLARACEEKGLLKSQAISFVEQNFIFYIQHAASQLFADPALARALLARAFGKLLT